uniref:Uncharacterized protein n=1 Tax=Caenorhabditis japonica TaxID=281687 RepID=A0A8R1EBA6_CAEJA
MDPNLNYNFGYGDNYTGATDHASDPVGHYGWGSQWSQPPSAAAQVNTFPQYVSQSAQQQHQPQQQGNNSYANIPYLL